MRLLRVLICLGIVVIVFSAHNPLVPTLDEDRVQVGATIFPLADFAQRIGGERVEVHLMVPPGGDAHNWEPSPGDIVLMERLDILLYNGAGLEHWVDAVVPTLRNDALISVETTAGLRLLCAGCDKHGAVDPHVWLSPHRAKEQARVIYYALIRADPEGKALYNANFRELADQFDALHNAFAEGIAPLPGRDIVVAHAAFGYLCMDFGLNQIAVQGFSPHAEPTPAGLAQVIRQTRALNINTIFFETGASDKVAQAIARETGARTAVLHPLETLTPAEIAAGECYFSIMYRNLEALKLALG